MKYDFKDKVVLVTGGTGSFGGMFATYLLKTDVKKIIVFSRDEKKQEDMRRTYPDPRMTFVIGDVRDIDSVNRAMKGVNYVFQAAALKQVPSCEFNPFEAVKTNVIGSENVLNAAVDNQVEKIVVLSTDKAVYPINTMGITKALMEKIAIAKARDVSIKGNGPKITITRYGNVMCSRGSVIPFFIDRILKGQPLTITDPNMTRFMMSLEQSVDLVLFALFDASQGEIAVQKSPAATVQQVAESLMRLLKKEVPLEIVGARHGEKMHESLCSKEEMTLAIDCEDYFRVPADLRNHDYSFQASNVIKHKNEYASYNTRMLNSEELDFLLKSQPYVKGYLK
ncbi:polysaccharide biosynthesis protein [Alishewanella sp. SMS8]|uniref:polysaccharide biosynthesis protein n=1 Tax=Alishewanella sp. SMS8 TaxID=2994676 RepID=UPI0027428D87|nr:polysaccharide biosynthesis protein [Alishewanella sp. SMS8]MDP5460133.1 polysaccharide biosynthesis protein [Alishewanella sp. SMS8]